MYVLSVAQMPATFSLPPDPRPLLTPTMHQVSRLVQAAAALSQLLRDADVPHAFYGNVLTAVMSRAPLADVCDTLSPLKSPSETDLCTGNLLHSRRWGGSSLSSRTAGLRRQRRLFHSVVAMEQSVCAVVDGASRRRPSFTKL